MCIDGGCGRRGRGGAGVLPPLIVVGGGNVLGGARLLPPVVECGLAFW